MHKLNHPEELTQIWVAIVVLALAIILEGFSLLGCLREIGLIRAERPFSEWLKHTRNSELVVVLGEDIGALLGLILALGFLATAAVTGNPVYDAMGSICIGVVLLIISIFIASRVRALLVGRSADPQVEAAIRACVEEHEDIEQIFNMITIQLGPDTMLALKVRMRPDLDIRAAAASINALETSLKAQVPKLAWCFIEPDVAD